jgi:hypothetical protein
MTDDIVARLRAAFDADDAPKKNIAIRKAADEIERLARENAALRAERDDLRQYAKNADKVAFEIAQNYWAVQRERDSLWDALDEARGALAVGKTND